MQAADSVEQLLCRHSWPPPFSIINIHKNAIDHFPFSNSSTYRELPFPGLRSEGLFFVHLFNALWELRVHRMYWNCSFFQASTRVSKMFLNKRISKKWRNHSIRCNKTSSTPALHSRRIACSSSVRHERNRLFKKSSRH